MNLSAYLTRIGYRGPVRPDLATLQALQRAHLHAIPFENLDVQLARPVHLDVQSAFHKIVQQRRGGWCYEMNGVLGWALQQIGFAVIRVSGGVMRQSAGDTQLGNHLCLLVSLDQTYLVDVGFGGSLLEPLPLPSSVRDDAPFAVALSETDDGYWRFVEVMRGAAFSFDFHARPADENLLAAKSASQQTDPASPFVQNLVVKQRLADAYVVLRGRVLTIDRGDNMQKSTLGSAQELVGTLRHWFGLDIPEAATLWPRICARHQALFPESAPPTTQEGPR